MSISYPVSSVGCDLSNLLAERGKTTRNIQRDLSDIESHIGSNYLKRDFLKDIWTLTVSDSATCWKRLMEMGSRLKLIRQERTLVWLMRKHLFGEYTKNPLTVMNFTCLCRDKSLRRASEDQFDPGLNKLEKERYSLEGSPLLPYFCLGTVVSHVWVSLIPAFCFGAACAGVAKFVSLYQELGDPPQPLQLQPRLRPRPVSIDGLRTRVRRD